MDKKTALAFGLIAVLVIVWLIFMSVNQPPKPLPSDKSEDTEQIDSNKNEPAAKSEKTKDSLQLAKLTSNTGINSDSLKTAVDSIERVNSFGYELAPFSQGTLDIIHIETDLVKAKISTKGGTILEWELKNYKHHSGCPTQLINNDIGELFLAFETKNKVKVDTRELYFKFDNENKLHYTVSGKDSIVLTGRIEVAPGKAIIKRFTFYGDSYLLGVDITMENMDNIVNKNYFLVWEDGLRFQENNSVDEANEGAALIQKNDEVDEISCNSDEPDTIAPKNDIQYAAMKIKYFGMAAMPLGKSSDLEIGMSGYHYSIQNHGMNKRFRMTAKKAYTGGIQTQSYSFYIGPLEYDIVKALNLENMINFGWRLIVRPIGEWFMLPLFKMIHMFISNFGISIIIFSIIIKILLYPLSISQMRSAQKMKLIQPDVNKIREKFKDDPKAQQAEMMKLYSEMGVNPAGGCLPLLLQMPILYALWAVLRTAIELRQAEFFLWIKDLSMPDVIFSLPFRLPLLNVDQFSGLALLMGITMFIQQKMTITDPKQKALVYMMPIMFTLMFSSFPSGLNLYYFMFNLLSIAQQQYINKFSKTSKLTIADLKAMPKKEGFFQKKMREAQEIAAAQGKTVPGFSRQQQQQTPTKSKYSRKKK